MYPLLLLLVLGVTPSVCKAGNENTCDVVPKDLYIEAGSSILVVCLTSCVRGKIYWTLDNKSVDESRYDTTNSTHAVLSLRNFTRPRATLQCHSNDTHQVLGGTTIRTYLKPSNLSCFLHYKLRKNTPDLFTCSWEHQVDPSLTIDYSLLRTDSSSSEPSKICSSSGKTCTGTYKSFTITLSGSYDVTVKAQTAFWEATSDPFEFKALDIIKIPQPELSNVTLSSDRLLVMWKIWPYHSSKRYHCQVNYSKMINEGTPKWNISEIEHPIQERACWSMTTESLESCSNYTVAVRCNLNKGPWSDWSPEKMVLSKLKKSDYEPRLWRKVAGVEKNGVRRVRAMWKNVPPTCQGTFSYTIRQTPYKENTTGVNHTAALCDSWICDVNQDAHIITLEVFHKDSLFAEDSVYVPAIGESLPKVTGIQTNSTPEGVIWLSWKAPAQPVSAFMIDYTHTENQSYWKETKDTHASLDALLDKTPYNITVTPLFDDKTGHGAQVLDICSGKGDPGNVYISVVPGHRSAYVSWDVTQEVCSDQVVSFTIFYSTEQGPELNVTASSKSHHTLQDLTPETQYSVYVKATAHTRTTNSEEKSFETTRFDPHFIRTLIICGTLLIFLVLSVGLCSAVQWKKFKNKLVPDPARSSVALLASAGQNMGPCTFEPSESICSSIYIEEAQTPSTFPPDTGFNENPASEQTGGYDDPAIAPATDRQTEDPVEPVETQPPSSPGELSHLLSEESGLSSPYRSQSPQETPAPKTSKPCKRVPVKQPGKMPQLSVYVSLDMFEQGQGR
ncbi:interleukin-31 receptor subunit alpha-like isoform 3-T3 [Acanthopagrus schlegelii]